MSTLDHKLEPELSAVHRLEVISGTGRRRQFTADFKARVVEATLVPGAIVSGVARRHGLTPQQVFTWRRQARQPLGNTESKAPQFVPAIVETALPPAFLRGRQRKRTGQAVCRAEATRPASFLRQKLPVSMNGRKAVIT